MEKNGTFGLARDGLGEQRFTRARRADEQHALGDARAHAGELTGGLEKSTISASSSFSSSAPATSEKRTLMLEFTLALVLPKSLATPPPPRMERNIMTMNTIMMSSIAMG